MIVLEYPRLPGSGFTDTGLLEIDATPVENYHAFAQATENPVEKGSVISDHTLVDAETMLFECVISNTPMRGFRDVITSRDQSAITAGVATVYFPENRVARTYDLLRRLRDASVPVRIITSWAGDFPNMVIEILSVTREIHTGQSLSFQLGFKRIRVVDSQTVGVVTEEPEPVEDRGKKNQHRGAQPKSEKVKTPQEVAVEEKASDASLLYQLVH